MYTSNSVKWFTKVHWLIFHTMKLFYGHNKEDEEKYLTNKEVQATWGPYCIHKLNYVTYYFPAWLLWWGQSYGGLVYTYN